MHRRISKYRVIQEWEKARVKMHQVTQEWEKARVRMHQVRVTCSGYRQNSCDLPTAMLNQLVKDE